MKVFRYKIYELIKFCYGNIEMKTFNIKSYFFDKFISELVFKKFTNTNLDSISSYLLLIKLIKLETSLARF